MPRTALNPALIALFAAIGGCAQAPTTPPAPLVLPAYPAPGNLLEFAVSKGTSNRFLLDRTSLRIDPEHETRLTIVVRTAQGVETVTHEAVRCQSAEYRIYAIGRNDGSWSLLQDPPWRRIREARGNRHRAALATEYLCEGATSVLTAEAVFAAMRNPAHLRQGVKLTP